MSLEQPEPGGARGARHDWPPAGWYYGPGDADHWGFPFNFAPPPAGFTADHALAWVDGVVRLYEHCLAEGVRIGAIGRPRQTALHNTLLLADDLCRRSPFRPPPRVTRDPDCGVEEDMSWLTALRDWLRRVAASTARRHSAGRPGLPFEVDLSDRNAPRLIRRTGDSVSIESIDADAAVVLDHLIRAGGLWVTGPQICRAIGLLTFRADRAKAKLPAWVQEWIEAKQSSGYRLRLERWRDAAETRP